MVNPLPLWLIVMLLAAGTAGLAGSTYVENEHLALLEAHPIWANLLSGIVGFCFGVPAVSGVISQMSTRATHRRQAKKVSNQLNALKGYLTGVGEDLNQIAKTKDAAALRTARTSSLHAAGLIQELLPIWDTSDIPEFANFLLPWTRTIDDLSVILARPSVDRQEIAAATSTLMHAQTTPTVENLSNALRACNNVAAHLYNVTHAMLDSGQR